MYDSIAVVISALVITIALGMQLWAFIKGYRSFEGPLPAGALKEYTLGFFYSWSRIVIFRYRNIYSSFSVEKILSQAVIFGILAVMYWAGLEYLLVYMALEIVVALVAMRLPHPNWTMAEKLDVDLRIAFHVIP